RQSLRRRRSVEHVAGAEREREQLDERGAAAFEIGARHWAADTVEIAGDLATDVAAVEIVEPGMGEMVERRGERCLLERRARIGRLAIEQECRREAGLIFEFGKPVGRDPRLA